MKDDKWKGYIDGALVHRLYWIIPDSSGEIEGSEDVFCVVRR